MERRELRGSELGTALGASRNVTCDDAINEPVINGTFVEVT